MLPTPGKCLICQNPKASADINADQLLVECPLCGRYRIKVSENATITIVFKMRSGVEPYLCSGLVRNYWEATGVAYLISQELVKSADSLRKLSPLPIPRDTDIPAKADLILLYLRRKSNFPGEIVSLDGDNEYCVGYCKNQREYWYCLNYLRDLKLVDEKTNTHGIITHDYCITAAGWAYLSGIGAEAKDQGFIAMSFKSELNPVSDLGLYPGIQNAGYKALRIDNEDHNDHIDDKIVAEIRKSKFLVTDLTGNNQGAYFEAGLAIGLGKPVIWTCEKTQLDNKDIHFDVSQYSIITWKLESLDVFANRLTQRIEATIGRGAYVEEAEKK